jgi:hypothetical protein
LSHTIRPGFNVLIKDLLRMGSCSWPSWLLPCHDLCHIGMPIHFCSFKSPGQGNFTTAAQMELDSPMWWVREPFLTVFSNVGRGPNFYVQYQEWSLLQWFLSPGNADYLHENFNAGHP